MTISTSSLRNLPPKQALLLLLAEKAQRTKRQKEREAQAAAMRVARRRYVDLGDESSSEPPQAFDIPSVVLDRNHPISDLYYKKARFKVYWGGRGSVKSWGSAEALIRLAAALPLRIMCCREYMTSIKQSSWRLLKDMIYRLGLESWFTITDSSIRSRAGAEFFFVGLHNNEHGIRSVEGVDICLVEEAQTVGDTSWQSLLPTIRKPGSEIWVMFNMREEHDATYQRFVVQLKDDPDAIIHFINHDSNPFFPEELRRQMERDKKFDYDLYEHIWRGKPRKRSNAIILGGKYVVEDFDDQLWRKADRLLFGGDFGFADDPSTLIRSFMLEVDKMDGMPVYDLYIEYEAYDHHVELLDMAAFYAGGDSITTPNKSWPGVPGAREWPIKADSARPETISYLRGCGFNISAAEKWPGSVEDGITHLRGFRRIVIHSRCVKTAEEAYLWRYKVDQKQLDENGQPKVLPVVVDRFNHCWDAERYSLDGHIQRSGAVGSWVRLGRTDAAALGPASRAALGVGADVTQRHADGSVT